MDLADHLRVVRTNWWKILIVALVVGGLAYAYSASKPKVYAANQLLSVASQDVNSAQTIDPNQIDFRTTYYAAVGNTPGVATTARAHEKLTSELTVDQTLSDIKVTATDTTGILQVSTTGRTSAEAVQIANGVSFALHELVTTQQETQLNAQKATLTKSIRALEQSLTTPDVRNSADLTNFVRQEIATAQQTLLTLQPTGFQVSALTDPIASLGPVSPHPKKSGLLGFLVALIFFGEGLVVLRCVRRSLRPHQRRRADHELHRPAGARDGAPRSRSRRRRGVPHVAHEPHVPRRRRPAAHDRDRQPEPGRRQVVLRGAPRGVGRRRRRDRRAHRRRPPSPRAALTTADRPRARSQQRVAL